MDGKLLFDTSVVVPLLNGDRRLAQLLHDVTEPYLPVVVLGELLFGAHQSTSVEKNVARVERFAASVTVLACDSLTANIYGSAKMALQRKGRPIPDNDLWIAALAIQHEMTLITRDRHFDQVDQLAVDEW